MFEELLPAVFDAVVGPAVSRCWRRQLHVLAALRALPFQCPTLCTHQAVEPIIDCYMDGGSAAVRAACAATMVWFSRFGPSGVMRAHFHSRVLSTYALQPLSPLATPPALAPCLADLTWTLLHARGVLCGTSWWRRNLFAAVVGAAAWLYSRAYIKEHFVAPLLSCIEVTAHPSPGHEHHSLTKCLLPLAPGSPPARLTTTTQDPVSSVRRRALLSLPLFRLWLRFPKDASTLRRDVHRLLLTHLTCHSSNATQSTPTVLHPHRDNYSPQDSS